MGVGLSIECIEDDKQIDWIWLALGGVALAGVGAVICLKTTSMMPVLPLLETVDRLRVTKCKFSSLINL